MNSLIHPYDCMWSSLEITDLDYTRFSLRRRQWHPTPVVLPGKSHGRRSLAGCSPWGREESDTTERLHFHFSLSCIGEGNGNPLQCSCLGIPGRGEPGGLPSMGSHRVRHDWSYLAAAAAADSPWMILTWKIFSAALSKKTWQWKKLETKSS